MKSKDLVKICHLCSACHLCRCDKICKAYYRQFKLYPFLVRSDYKYPPEANSDTKIQYQKGD